MNEKSSAVTDSPVAPDVHPGLRAWVILALLTIFAGAIRFFDISRPPLWYDESMVFRRTCGSYGQLLDCLRVDGFVPLHYSFVWLIGRIFKLTPVTLRFFPALCGTLIVPAVYFLARQMLPHRTSLLASAFTVCSAFMLFYSRDAKMYMESWLFITLNAGCLLWWFRSIKSTAWLCWIATGCAACGLQMLSVIPIGISLLLLFTQRTMRWQQSVLWVVGLILILSGPVGYYEKFNVWKDRVEEDGWERSGLDWINDYNHGRTGPELIRLLGTSTLMGWEWPKDLDLPLILPAGRVAWPQRGADALLVFFFAGCLPWPRRWQGAACCNARAPATPVLRYPEEPGLPQQMPFIRGKPRVESVISSPPEIPVAILLSPDPALRITSEPASPEPQWRIALWLSFWIVIPVYGFYCRSIPYFFSPIDWWHWVIQTFPFLLLPVHHHWVCIPIGLLLVITAGLTVRYGEIRPMIFRGLKLLIVAAVIIGLCQVIWIIASKAAANADKPWKSMWVPRYIGFIWPMLAIAAAALLMRLPTRPLRYAMILFVFGLNLGIASYRIFGRTEPPVDLMAADAFAAQDAANPTLLWTHLLPSKDSPGGENLYGQPGEYYLELLENKPTDPVLFQSSMLSRRRLAPLPWLSPWDHSLPTDLNKIIFWTEYDSKGNPIFKDPTPPADWKLQSDEWFTARDCWIWQDLDRYRRSVYVKSGN